MAVLAPVSALTLAVVFVWAASAKLARLGTTHRGFADLGLPAAGVLAPGVPAAELVTAALLVAVPRAGGIVALAVLAAFTAVVARAVLNGSTAGCTCFGTVSRRPVSATDLLRNALLGALALVAAVPSWPTVALAAVSALAWVRSLRARVRGGRYRRGGR
jgi:uncharacterized membrane protein YphA (DoxX/SURF4 family)